VLEFLAACAKRSGKGLISRRERWRVERVVKNEKKQQLLAQDGAAIKELEERGETLFLKLDIVRIHAEKWAPAHIEKKRNRVEAKRRPDPLGRTRKGNHFRNLNEEERSTSLTLREEVPSDRRVVRIIRKMRHRKELDEREKAVFSNFSLRVQNKKLSWGAHSKREEGQNFEGRRKKIISRNGCADKKTELRIFRGRSVTILRNRRRCRGVDAKVLWNSRRKGARVDEGLLDLGSEPRFRPNPRRHLNIGEGKRVLL